MAGGRKAPRWRGRFLRALRRTGNVAAAARAAGVHKSSAYLRRKADAGFAAKWDAALAAGKAAAGTKGETAGGKKPLHRLRRSPSPGNPGEEMIVRNSKNGAQMVRAGAGRWCRRIEQAFLADYAQSGSIRRAARTGQRPPGAGFVSRNALLCARATLRERARPRFGGGCP